jgi:hypothetical protein
MSVARIDHISLTGRALERSPAFSRDLLEREMRNYRRQATAAYLEQVPPRRLAARRVSPKATPPWDRQAIAHRPRGFRRGLTIGDGPTRLLGQWKEHV